jgi:hypothetical protein
VTAGPDVELRGTVSDYDDAVGMGEVVPAGSASGDPARYPFHCTQIADGSRTIAVGTPVTFRVIPGRLGRWEAGAVRPTR